MTVLFVRVYYMKYHVKIWHAFKGGGNVEGSFIENIWKRSA